MALRRCGAVRYPHGDKALDALLGNGWRKATGTLTRRIGEGEVVFVASDEWPATLGDQYEALLQQLAEQTVAHEKERGWFEANKDVEFACYEQPDGTRVFYLLNIRWWDRKTSSAVFQCGKRRKTVSVPYGNILVFR